MIIVMKNNFERLISRFDIVKKKKSMTLKTNQQTLTKPKHKEKRRVKTKNKTEQNIKNK